MSAGWQDWTGSQDACVKKAAARLHQKGFNANFEVLNNRTIYGEIGQYTAVIRCFAEKKIAFVAVAGPNGDQCGKYLDAIKDRF